MLDNLKILLVDDDEDDYLITRETLEDCRPDGLDLTWTTSYDSGLDAIVSGKFDVCLVDYSIGAHTGLEFVREAKSRGVHCPMILLTGVGQHDIDVAATEAGAADFLDKSSLDPQLVERSIRYAIANANALLALAEQSSLMSTMLENAGAAIAALDAAGQLVSCNHEFETLLTVLADSNSCDAQHGRRDAISQLSRSIADKLEIEVGGGRVFEVRKNRTPHGGTVLIAVDMTEQKNITESLVAAKSALEANNRAKSAFLANVSHEFRTPLNSIIGFSELIVNARLGGDLEDFAEHINKSSVHLLGIINDVLSFSRLESGEGALNETVLYDLDVLISFCVRQVEHCASKRDVGITSNCDDRIAGLKCDAMSVRRILINLLSNAVRFSDQAGKVDVFLSLLGNQGLRLGVKDQGIGMDPAQVETAFIPFRQLDQGYDRQAEGTGLGLAMVKTMAELHGATIQIETAPGDGTTVLIDFPPDRVVIQEPQSLVKAS